MNYSTRRADSGEVDAIATLHRQAFSRQGDSEAWVRATLAAWPRIFVFVLVCGGEVCGYIFWAQKSGIRLFAVVELDQVAIRSDLRGKGFGEFLIGESLAHVKAILKANGQSLTSILVSARADNDAQHIYEKAMGAKVVATVENLYSSTEVFMVAKIVDP